jgi:segregation and condensation protein A
VAYSITLPVFEGPLDLLLHLIRTHKLDIGDIPIALVTEQYLQYLALMEALDLNVAGEFLVMAATLMEIKSRMLLPRPDPPPADDEEGGDPRAELVARLLEYERFQHVAEQLRDLAAESGRSFTRSVVEQWEGATPLVELRPGDLLEAIRRMQAPGSEGAGNGAPATLRVRRQAINLRQRIGEVLRRVQSQEEPLAFTYLVTRSGQRLRREEVLITFLAILELVRLGQVTAWQQPPRGEIFLTARAAEPSPPPESV